MILNWKLQRICNLIVHLSNKHIIHTVVEGRFYGLIKNNDIWLRIDQVMGQNGSQNTNFPAYYGNMFFGNYSGDFYLSIGDENLLYWCFEIQFW